MILKLIPLDLDKAGRKSKATNIADLTEYIAVPDDAARLTRLGYHIDHDGVIHGGDGEQPEKVLYARIPARHLASGSAQPVGRAV